MFSPNMQDQLLQHEQRQSNLARVSRLLGTLLLAFSFFAGAVPDTTFAKVAMEIVAEVNGNVITNYKISQRVAFLRMITNLDDTPANRLQLQRDAQQMLIDEILKREAAESIDPTLESRAKNAARQLVNENFALNGKNGTEVLQNSNIDVDTVQDKFVADLIWNEYIKYKFQAKFGNLDSTVDRVLERIDINSRKPQFKLSEIFLMPVPNRPLDATFKLAEEIIKAVRRGANFNAIARQYSAAGSAANGGQIGWVLVDQLPTDIRQALDKIPIGDITHPLQQNGLIVIMRKDGEMVNGVVDPSQDIITLARATIDLNNDASNADRLETAARLEKDLASIDSCEEMVSLNNAYGSKIPSLIENITVASLAPQMRQKIDNMRINNPSSPLAFKDGVSSFMVCQRVKPGVEKPSRDEVYKAEWNKVFGTLSERYLVRLRRSAVIATK
jgi:peptidyl-prolyl cis-trans isomerase SurA